MAHKTLVGGTAYEISGGKTLVEGTSYSVKNGKVLIGGSAYDISFLLPPAALNLWNGTESSVNCILYANGYWVVGGTIYEGSYYRGRIAYATSLDGTWTTLDLWSGSSSSSNYVSCITYANGYWVVAGTQYEASSGRAIIACTTNIEGTWTVKYPWTGSSSYNGIKCITYADGYWVVGGSGGASSTYYARIAYATSPDATWTTKVLLTTSSSATSINCIIYSNGYFVAGGQYTSGNYTYAFIGYATHPAGDWKTKDLWNDTSGNSVINCIIYADGYWVAGGRAYIDGYNRARIAYVTSLPLDWTTKNLWGNIYNNWITCITYVNGYWVVGGKYSDSSYNYARIAYSTTLDGTWTTVDLNSSSRDVINDITYSDDYIVAGGIYYYGGATYARIYYSPTLEGFEEITI